MITSCKGSQEITDPQSSLGNVPVKILISEVFTGVEGNNQADFIELYNAGTTIADLNGYTLWYQLNDSSEEILLFEWTEETLIPPLGYYALIQANQFFAIQPDETFQSTTWFRIGVGCLCAKATKLQISSVGVPVLKVWSKVIPAVEMQPAFILGALS